MRILWIPHTGWHIPQRAHLFCEALSARHEVHVTNWVADFVGIRDYLSIRYLRNYVYRRRQQNGITIHHIPRISPAIFSTRLRQLNQQIFSWYVQRIIKQYAIDVVVGTYLVPPPVGARVIFDLFDENVSSWREAGFNALADEIEANESAYLKRADAVVAASSVLVDKARAAGTKAPIHFIPNGIELDQFAPYQQQTVKSNPPIVGSVANFDDMEEMRLILDAFQSLGEQPVSGYLAGRGRALDYARKRVQSDDLIHVQIEGPIPRHKLPETINRFDVGLCIYKQSIMDDARSPMRVMSYAALGIPSVVTDVEEVRRIQFPNVIRVQPTAESIASGIRSALSMRRQIPVNIADYDLARGVAQYESILQDLTSRPSTPEKIRQ